MRACDGSQNLISLVETFELGDKTYVVTRYAKGGDLLRYMTDLGVNCLNEQNA